MGHQRNRILRNYRNTPPSKFHAFNQRVSTALTDNSNIPQSTWGANPTLLTSYFTTSDKHDALYHQALLGSKLDISARDLLQEQLTNYLDEIALVLEAAALSTPDILLSSGFDVSKERRSRTRTKPASSTSEVSTDEQQGQQS